MKWRWRWGTEQSQEISCGHITSGCDHVWAMCCVRSGHQQLDQGHPGAGGQAGAWSSFPSLHLCRINVIMCHSVRGDSFPVGLCVHSGSVVSSECHKEYTRETPRKREGKPQGICALSLRNLMRYHQKVQWEILVQALASFLVAKDWFAL